MIVDDKIIYTRAETAKLLRMSLRTWTRIELRGDAPPRLQLSDRVVGYRASDLEAWIAARATAAPAQPPIESLCPAESDRLWHGLTPTGHPHPEVGGR